MSADSPRRSTRGVPAIVPPQVVSDRSIIDNVAGFINDVALTNQPQADPKDTIAWARFEQSADISDPTFGDDWEIDGNISPPLLLILGYGLGVQVWAIPANGEAIEVLSWRHGNVTTLRVLPTPFSSDDEMADEPIDNYGDKRPLMAICDGTGSSSSGAAQTCYSVNFVSLKTGAQVKTIKFKYAVLDVLANRTSVVITFPERIAVFDARTLEDRLSVTTCYPSPGINPNPVALGPRWMAYAENKILHSKRSGGGCDGDGVSSYTATVLNAAKSFGKGLRELGEQMAAGLTGSTTSGMSSKSGSFDSGSGDIRQTGVVTILDIKNPIKDISPTTGAPISINGSDPIMAHFIAHSDAIVAMEFDFSGMLLVTADRRGHDFHVFRIQPHPAGAHLAAVHHLYILHRGDTSAKVQNISFALDSRWVAVSTLRGTTHVFPITPYGGSYGVRTHSSLHVVNKLSRFHRSAGLSGDNRSNSPISHSESMTFNQLSMPYHNPTMPPFPRPHTILPLAQLRQPTVLASPPGSAQNLSYQKAMGGGGVSNRQRLSSLSDDSGKPLSVCAVFAKGRSWLLDPPNVAREGPAHKLQRKAVDSLFIMAGHGALIQYDLDTKLASNVAKEKICDDTPIELEVEAKAQWNLGRRENIIEIQPPLTSDNWLVKDRNTSMAFDTQYDDCDDRGERWLSQVEIITHAGPHRRLWMGPQFVFKTYNTPSGSSLSHIDSEAIEIGVAATTNKSGPGRSSPMNMPLGNSGRSAVPVLIESGSYSSIEQSPKLMDRFKHDHMDSDVTLTQGESRLKEDLADAMRESPSVQHKDTGLTPTSIPTNASCATSTSIGAQISCNTTPITSGNPNPNDMNYYNLNADYNSAYIAQTRKNSKISNMTSSITSSLTIPEEDDELTSDSASGGKSIEKIVNPLGTVTTITRSLSDTDFEKQSYDPADHIILENCDESLFRPVVTIFCDEKNKPSKEGDLSKNSKNKNVETVNRNSITTKDGMTESEYFKQPPEPIGTKLVVPVIEKSIKIDKKSTSGPSSTATTTATRTMVKVVEEKNSNKNKVNNTKYNENKNVANTEQSDINKLVEVNNKTKTIDIKGEKSQKFTSSVEKHEPEAKIVVQTDNKQISKVVEMTAIKNNNSKTNLINEIGIKKPDDKRSRKSAEKEIRKSPNNQKPNAKESETIVDDESKAIEIRGATKETNKQKTKYESSKDIKKNKEELKLKETFELQCDNKTVNVINKIEIDESKEEATVKEKKQAKQDDKNVMENKAETVTDSVIKTNTYTRRTDETNIAPQRKPSKDEDSESFESLENMSDYDKSADYKQRKISDNFESAEDCHHESDKSSTCAGNKWEDDDDIKMEKKKAPPRKEASPVIDTVDGSASNSVEITITLPKKGKNNQNKQKSKQQIDVKPKVPNFEKEPFPNSGLEFFDKFSHNNEGVSNENISCNVDFKTLQDSLHEDLVAETADLVIKSHKAKAPSPPKDLPKPKKGGNRTKENISSMNQEPVKEFKVTLPNNNSKKKARKAVSPEITNVEDNIETASSVLASSSVIPTKPTKLERELEFPALPTFDTLSSDFKDTFLPPLSPLEPFETKFDDFNVESMKKTDEHFSLINFESPDSPKNTLKKSSPITSIEPKPRGFTQDTLIFALCGSLHYENETENEEMKTSTISKDEKFPDLMISSSTSRPTEDIMPPDVVEGSFKRKNKKKENAMQKGIGMQGSTTAITSSSTSSSEETEESSSSIACNKHHKQNVHDDEELRPLIDVSMTQSISCGNGNSLSEISSIASKPPSKKAAKKPKTMSQILKGEIDDDDDIDADDDDDDDKNKTNKNKIESTKSSASSTASKARRTSLTKSKLTKPLPDISNQSDSSTASDQNKTSEEPASSESSDEQLILSKKSISKNKKSSTTTTCTIPITTTTVAANMTNTTITFAQIAANEDSSESDTKISNLELAGNNSSLSSSGTGNDSGSGGVSGGADSGGGENGRGNLNGANANKFNNNNNNTNNNNNNNSSNNSNQNGKKKSKKKRR